MTYSPRWILISLALIALMIFLHYKNFKPKFIFPVAKLSPRKYRWAQIAKYVIIICVVLLPLKIGFVADKTVSIQKATPVQIILDVSLSMSAYDITPSRFAVAKKALLQLIDQLQWYNISLISFSGVPVVSIPFSQDSRAVAYAVNDLSLADFPAAPEFLGTAIGDALLLGVKNLQQVAGSLPGIMILITDGDSNEWYDPVQVITLLRKQHIAVSTLGIGNNNYLIGYDQWQQPISTSLNTDLLQNIAQQTSWTFLRGLTTDDVNTFFQSLLTTIKRNEVTNIGAVYRYIDSYLLWMTLFGLIALLYLNISSLCRPKNP